MTRMSSPVVRRGAVVVAAIAGVALAAGPAAASSGGPAPTPPPRAAPSLGMSARTYQRMLAQIPLDAAATKIRAAAAATSAGRAGLVQIAVDGDHHTLTVYWHGAMPAAMRPLLTARPGAKVMVQSARYTLAQLTAAATQIMTHHAANGAEIAGPLVNGDGLQVGVPLTRRHLPAMTAATAQRTYGTAIPIHLTTTAAAMRQDSCGAASFDGATDNAGPGSRCNDLSPGFWGGAVVEIFANGAPNAFCSTGFGVHFPNGQTGMLTAGHCINGTDIQADPAWWNGQLTTNLGFVADTPYLNEPDALSTDDDGVIITPGGSGNQMYDGPSILNGDTHNHKTIVGQQPSNVGDWLCDSGALSGVHCGIQVTATNQVGNISGVPTANFVEAQGTGTVSINGDSGGPVFSLAGTPGTITAKGTIIGTGGPGILLYTPMDVITSDLGVTVNTSG